MSSNPAPAAGEWGGLEFLSGSAGTLQFVTVEDSGQTVFTTDFGIRVSGPVTSPWNHVTLTQNNSTGLLVDGTGSVAITSSNFENGPSAGVIDNGTGSNVSVTNSYWNSTTGPNIGTNPGGTGDAIIGSNAAGVSFSPFSNTPN